MSLSTGCVLDVDASAIESGISRDRNHHTLTPTATTTVRGKAGKGTLFNGTTSFVDCGNDSSLDITDAITIEAWVKGDDFSSDATIAAINNLNNWWLHWDVSETALRFIMRDGDNNLQHVWSNTSLIAERWYHIASTYSNKVVAFYLDGNADGGGTFTKGMKTTSYQSLVIGSYNVAGSVVFNGTISSVKIYNYALSATQIKRHYLEKAYLHVPHPVRIP